MCWIASILPRSSPATGTLPCRISIYEDGGKTIVGMIPPTELLKLVSDDPRIEPAARQVQEAMEKIIEASI